MELYNALEMPLSSDSIFREIQTKIIQGEPLSISEKIVVGRDHPIKEIAGYKLKPDHVYRTVSERVYNEYLNAGCIFSDKPNDEYQEFVEDGKTFNNNAGIDWYLAGTSLKYGGADFILEVPAYKNYFFPAYDNGNHLSFDPTVKHFKSSGTKTPVPIDLITRVFDLREYLKHIDDQNAKEFIKVIDIKGNCIYNNMLNEHIILR